MKKIGIIILTILIMFVGIRVNAKEYTSDFYDFVIEPTGFGLMPYSEPDEIRSAKTFKTPHVYIKYAYFTKGIDIKDKSSYVYFEGIKGEEPNSPHDLRFKVYVELYDANKNLIQKYSTTKTDDSENINTIIKIENYDNAKYYKIKFDLIDDFFLDQDANQDTIIGIYQGDISLKNWGEDEGKYNVYTWIQNLYAVMKPNAKYTLKVPKRYTLPGTNKEYTLKMRMVKYTSSTFGNTKEEDDREDDDFYYLTCTNNNTYHARMCHFSREIEMESPDNSVFVPIITDIQNDMPISQLKIRNTLYYTGKEMIMSTNLKEQGLREVTREEYDGLPNILEDTYYMAKDVEVKTGDYVYYYRDHNKLNSTTAKKISNDDWLIIVVVVLFVAVIVVAIIVFRKPKKQNPPTTMNRPPMGPQNMNRPPVNPGMNNGQPNMMNRPPMAPNQPPQPPMQQYNPNMNNQNNPSNRF